MKALLLLICVCSLLFSKDYKNSSSNDTKTIKTKSVFDYECGKKKYCTQMKSCKEAMYFLKICGLSRLDRDKDGIPCEKICGNH